MKTPKKQELKEQIESLESQNEQLRNALEKEQREQWEKQTPRATEQFHKDINKIYPGMICRVTFEHVDASGFWFAYELINDNRRQTYSVRHSDLI